MLRDSLPRCRAYVLAAALLLVKAELASGGANAPTITSSTFPQPINDIRWIGPHKETLLLQTNDGHLHRSVDGGKAWVHITTQIGIGVRVAMIMISPANRSVLAVVGIDGAHHVSEDAGATWRYAALPSGRTKFWQFHDTRSNWALFSAWSHNCPWVKGPVLPGEDTKAACNHAVYMTKDLGRTFSEVSTHTVQYDWGNAPFQDRVYFTSFRKKDVPQPKFDHWTEEVDFSYTDDGGKTISTIIPGGNKFVCSHGFVIVARIESKKLGLMVSPDAGAHFKAAVMPRHVAESSYIVLDTSEGVVVLHVHHGNDIGHVYVSDATGVHFTLSLEHNVRGRGQCGFENVMNLRGIYLANIRNPSAADFVPGDAKNTSSENDDWLGGLSSRTQTDLAQRSLKEGRPRSLSKRQTLLPRDLKDTKPSDIRTVVSFDMGGAWRYLRPPAKDSLGEAINCPPDTCWLHLHDITEFDQFVPFYSYTNAVGIIMGTGNVGPYLEKNRETTNTYLSRDGGLSWMEAHKGDYIYEFGNHGALLIMTDWVHPTRFAYYSTNQGHSWHTFEFSTVPMKVTNILTELNAMSTKFILFGTRGNTGQMYHLDFDTIRQRTCQGLDTPDVSHSDYESWTPTDGKSEERCLLGRQRVYTRRKQMAECLNNKDSKWPVDMKNCSCTDEDYTCEEGFRRNVGSMDCLPQHASDFLTNDFGGPGVCSTSKFANVDSYRKVVGDTCHGGWLPEKFRLDCETIRNSAASEPKPITKATAAIAKPASRTGRIKTTASFTFKVALVTVVIIFCLSMFAFYRSQTLRETVLSICLGSRAYSNVGDIPQAATEDVTNIGVSAYKAPSKEMQEIHAT